MKAVGAIGINGVQAPYSEPGANLVVCAPSNSYYYLILFYFYFFI